MSYKKSFLMLLFFPFILLSLLALCVLYVDPVQMFSKGYFIEEKFDRNLRQQNRGIIANVDFDGAILGTSMLENTSALEAADLLGGKWVNLSTYGSNFYERGIFLNYLLQNKEIKSIMYSFDWCFSDKMYDVRPKNAKWPVLYSNDIAKSLTYYYNAKYINRTVKYFFSFKQTKAPLEFFDCPLSWGDREEFACRFGGLENWVASIDKKGMREFITQRFDNTIDVDNSISSQIVCDDKLRMQYLRYIDENIVEFVKEYPETMFHIVIPPYSRYRYAEMCQINGSDFALHQETIRHIVNASAQYPNLKVYGFEDMDFLDDISNYRDTSHYHQSINSMMTHAIADGTHILTPENIELYLAKCDELAQEFNIKKFCDDICALMVKHGLDPKTGKKIQ